MLIEDTERIMRDISDHGLLRHGFVDYMRDYELLVDSRGPNPGTPELPDGYRVRFRNCVYAETRTTVAPETWRRSLGDERLDVATADADPTRPQGYLWGIRVQFLWPGGSVVTPSALATEWSESVGIEFCEVEIECNAHHIRLVYSGIHADPWNPATLDAAPCDG